VLCGIEFQQKLFSRPFRNFVGPDPKAREGVLGPNIVVIATSAASRSRASKTKPILGTLFRASNGQAFQKN
jgi:hypothetical protein